MYIVKMLIGTYNQSNQAKVYLRIMRGTLKLCHLITPKTNKIAPQNMFIISFPF